MYNDGEAVSKSGVFGSRFKFRHLRFMRNSHSCTEKRWIQIQLNLRPAKTELSYSAVQSYKLEVWATFHKTV